MFFRIVAPATLGPAASAFCTLASGNAPIVARPPATRPERRRKLRRSRPTPDCLPTVVARLLRRVWRSVLLINTAQPPSARISVDLVEGLHIGRVCLVTGLLFIRIRFGRGALGGERPGRGRNQTRAGAHRAQKIATA